MALITREVFEKQLSFIRETPLFVQLSQRYKAVVGDFNGIQNHPEFIKVYNETRDRLIPRIPDKCPDCENHRTHFNLCPNRVKEIPPPPVLIPRSDKIKANRKTKGKR